MKDENAYDLWRVGNKARQGTLGRIKKFEILPAGLSAVEVTVPESLDGKINDSLIGDLVSENVRSFELWWDGGELKMVLCAGSGDIDKYRSAVDYVYGAVQTTQMESNVPEWWHENLVLRYFDVAWQHGHYALNLKGQRVDILSQIATFIQNYQSAWVQVVFQSRDVKDKMALHRNELARAKERLKENADFQKVYKDLDEHARQKGMGPQVAASIRVVYDVGKMQYDPNYEDDGPLTPQFFTRSEHDSLVAHGYGVNTINSKIMIDQTEMKWCNLFPLRLLPGNGELEECQKNYCSLDWRGRLKERVSPPFILLGIDEFSRLHNLLPPGTDHLKTTRNVSKPEGQTSRKGFNIGFRDRVTLDASKYHEVFGKLVDSKEADCAVLPPEDILTHAHIVASTGHGKSSVIMTYAKHLEIANIYAEMPQDVQVGELRGDPKWERYLGGLDGTKTIAELGLGLKTALIYVDPKGDDSEGFVRMHEPHSLQKGRVRYLDVNRTKFSMNPLEIPPHLDAEEREAAVSMGIGYLLKLFEGWFGDTEAYVRLKRILDTVLRYLYEHVDDPTLGDMREIAMGLQTQGMEYLPALFNEIGEPSESIRASLESVASYDKQAYDSVLNRLDMFATDSVFKDMFCSRNSTVSFDELFRPGNQTVVRLARSELPPKATDMAMQSFVLLLWLAILKRADKVGTKDLTPVVLILDEFQVVANITVLETMIEQARSKGLGLVLAHQTLGQLDKKLLDDILGNCSVRIAGHMGGMEAGHLANSWDPTNSKDLKGQIPALPRYRWLAMVQAAEGQEQPHPVQFWAHYDTESGCVLRDNMTDEEWGNYVCQERERHLACRNMRGLLSANRNKSRWVSQIEHGKFFDRFEWLVMVAASKEPQTLEKITRLFGGTPREDVGKICDRMGKDGLLQRVGSDGNAAKTGKYAVTPEAKSKYLTFDPGAIGSAADIPSLMEEVAAWYAERGCFVAMARQKIRANQNRTDMVVYDYESGEAISVELESASEVNSHPEHVKKNLKKWPMMGFDKCEMWSYSKKIMDVARKFADEARQAKQFGKKGADKALDAASRVTVRRLEQWRNYRSDMVSGDDGPQAV